MAIGVFLSPSSQPWNSCKAGDTEEDHCRKIGSLIKGLFDKDNRFNCVLCDEFFSMTEDQRLQRAVQLSNNFYNQNGQNTWHICLHSDAFNGSASGFSSFYIGDGSSKKLATILASNFGKISPWELRSLKEYPALYELRKTLASAILFEMNFHDEINQANWIHSNMLKIALCFYQSICQAENLSPLIFDEEKKPTPPPVVVDGEQWKKDIVKECIDLKLLEDPTWIKKINEGMPVFAVCSMFKKFYKLYSKK